MKPRAWLMAGTMALAACPALAQDRMRYTAPDGVNGVNVTTTTPLPVTVTGSSATNQVNLSQVSGANVLTAGVAGSQGVGGTSASGAADDGSNPVKMGCMGAVGAFPTAITNGQRANILCSAQGAPGLSAVNGINGAGLVSLSNGTTVNAGGGQSLSVDPTGESWTEITTAASTTIKGAPGYLHNVCVNTPIASATIKIYNALSAIGTPLTITLPSTITGESPFCMVYDVAFQTGIFVVTSGATDVTVTYR